MQSACSCNTTLTFELSFHPCTSLCWLHNPQVSWEIYNNSFPLRQFCHKFEPPVTTATPTITTIIHTMFYTRTICLTDKVSFNICCHDELTIYPHMAVAFVHHDSWYEMEWHQSHQWQCNNFQLWIWPPVQWSRSANIHTHKGQFDCSWTTKSPT